MVKVLLPCPTCEERLAFEARPGGARRPGASGPQPLATACTGCGDSYELSGGELTQVRSDR